MSWPRRSGWPCSTTVGTSFRLATRVVEDYVGFAVKSGTPKEIIARLNEAMNKALQKPKVREALANLGAEPAGGTSAEFGALISSQIARWGKVVKDSGIKMPE